jgi:hypothetical protein
MEMDEATRGRSTELPVLILPPSGVGGNVSAENGGEEGEDGSIRGAGNVSNATSTERDDDGDAAERDLDEDIEDQDEEEEEEEEEEELTEPEGEEVNSRDNGTGDRNSSSPPLDPNSIDWWRAQRLRGQISEDQYRVVLEAMGENDDEISGTNAQESPGGASERSEDDMDSVSMIEEDDEL